MSSRDDLPRALPSMWRALKRGYEAEPRLLVVAFGFSLLTANPEAVHHPLVASIAARAHATPAQVKFRFAQAVGILPLTGTSNAEHMKQDLASRHVEMLAEEVKAIESPAAPADLAH